MIRGVNKQIIEINETENEYFDRAILFVRPQKNSTGSGCLQTEAALLLNGMTLSKRAKRKIALRKAFMISASAVIGSCATVLALVLLGIILI